MGKRSHEDAACFGAPRFALRPAEAAESIGVSVGTFQALVDEGKMPKAITIPGHRIVRYDAEAVRLAWRVLADAGEEEPNPWDEESAPFLRGKNQWDRVR